MNWFAWIIVIVFAILYVKDHSKPNKTDKKVEMEPEQEKGSTNYSKSYQAKYLLTRNEWYEFKKLKQLTDAKGLMICPKVRLLDIIEPRKGDNYRSLMGKIQSKHVDFVICDQDLHIKAVLELDDGSHDRKDRQERDQFVDQILTSVGYKVIHVRSVTEQTLADL